MSTLCIHPIAEAWESFKDVSGLSPIASEQQYDRVIALMDRLVEDGALDDNHSLHDLFLLSSDLVRQYEQDAYPLPDISGTEMLRFLMEQHDLRQTDFTQEIGSQGVVSEILAGKRELNRNHIAALANRFSVSPAAFF